jgi:hypothetical protein
MVGGDQDTVAWIPDPNGGPDQRAWPGRHDGRINRWVHVYQRPTASRRSHALSLIRLDPPHPHLVADPPRVTPPRSRRISEISFDVTHSHSYHIILPVLPFP